MTTYILFEGRTSNDNDMATNFRKRERAMKAFNASKYAYAVIHVYEGSPDDVQANYIDTIAEKSKVSNHVQ